MTAPEAAPARRRAPFAALLSAYAVSVLGTSMSELAIPWLVLTTTGSAGKTGLVAFAEMAPYVVAQALSGPLVERAGLRRSFVGGNVLAAVAMGAIPLTYATGTLSFAVLVVLVAVAGGVRGAADCANSALVPTTAEVGRIPLERAAGLNSGTNRLALLLGAPLGGVLVSLTNPAVAVAADAASFLVAALVVLAFVRGVAATPPPVHDAGPPPGDAAGPPPVDAAGHPGSAGAERVGAVRRYGRDLAEGMRFLRRDRLLLGICVMVAASNLLDQGWSAVLVPVWVRQELHSAAALGLLFGGLGLGAVIGNLLGAWLGPRIPRRALYGWGFLLGAAPRFLVLVVASTLSPVFVTFVIADIFGGSINSVIGATAYERIPPHLLPRVLGVIRASAWVGIPFGALVAGLVTDATGVRTAALIGAVCMLATTLAPFVFPAWREMRRPPPAGTAAPAEATAAGDTTAPAGAAMPADSAAPAQRAAESAGTAKT